MGHCKSSATPAIPVSDSSASEDIPMPFPGAMHMEVLSPEAEINLYGKDDPAMGIGSGLSDANVGLRLRHELKREFAPYVGINWSKKFGKTADFARADGEKTEDTEFVAGVRFWF